MPRKYFKCSICNIEKPDRWKGLIIGSGLFTEFVCRNCSRENYSIYGTFENLNDSETEKTTRRINSKGVKEWLKSFGVDMK